MPNIQTAIRFQTYINTGHRLQKQVHIIMIPVMEPTCTDKNDDKFLAHENTEGLRRSQKSWLLRPRKIP